MSNTQHANFNQADVEDYVAAHGFPSALAAGEIALAAGMWMAGEDYATIASEIVARRHPYKAAGSEPGSDPARVWCLHCNCTPLEHAQQFGAVE